MKINKLTFLFTFIFWLFLIFPSYSKGAMVACSSDTSGRSGTCNMETHNCWRCSYDAQAGGYIPAGDHYHCLPKESSQPTTGTVSIRGGNMSVTYTGCVTANNSGIYQKEAEEFAAKFSNSNDECKTVSERLSDLKVCILCPIFKVILDTDQVMATKAYASLAAGFRNVIIVVLALYIAYQTLIVVSALTKQDAAKYLGSLMVQSFKVLLAAILLSNASYVYDWVINPLMKGALNFGMALINSDIAKKISEAQGYTTKTSGVISQDLISEIMTTVYYFNSASMTIPAIGGALICTSTHAAAWLGWFPNLSMLISGLVCSVFGWMISLACLFYLLDSVVRFGIFCTLLPFLIASWPFKVSFKYTKVGWDIFMNTLFNFITMGLVISMSSELMVAAMTSGPFKQDQKAEHGYDLTELQKVLDDVNEDNVDKLTEAFSLSGTKFLVLLACCIFAFKLVQQVNELAESLSGTSGGSGIGNKIGGTAAQAAKRVAVGSKGADGKQHGGALGVGKDVLAATGVTGLVQGAKDKINQRTDSVRAAVGGGARTSSNNSAGNTNAGNQGSSGTNAGAGNSGGTNNGGNNGSGNQSV